MKIGKSPQGAQTTLTDEQIIRAQRYQDRIAREKENIRPKFIDPMTRSRVAMMLKDLVDEMAMAGATARAREPWHPPVRQARLTPEQLAAEYASRPIGLSDELRDKMRLDPKVGEL